MARRLSSPNRWGGTTDHSGELLELRLRAELPGLGREKLLYALAADLLEAHDQTGISLDDWPTARQFVETLLGRPVLPNLV